MPSVNVKFTNKEFERLQKCKPEGESWKVYMLSSTWIKESLTKKPKKEWTWETDKPPREKPCHKCGFCPYGLIVKMFPLQHPRNEEISCFPLERDCPVFYLARPITE